MNCIGRRTWRGFLRTYRRETGVKLFLRLNTSSPRATRADLLKQPWGSEWLSKLDEMRRRFATCEAHIGQHDPQEWWSLGNGGFQRSLHVDHSYERVAQ